MIVSCKFFKKRETDQIWWVSPDAPGVREFSFDKETIFSLYGDYEKLTETQKNIFARENPWLVLEQFGRNDMVVYQALLEQDKEHHDRRRTEENDPG